MNIEELQRQAEEDARLAAELSDDHTPAGAGPLQTQIPPDGRRTKDITESQTWKELQNMKEGKTPKLKKKAGGLPSKPQKIEAWLPEPSDEGVAGPVEGPDGPAGPSPHDAFRAHKIVEDGGDPQEEIDPLVYIQENFEGAPTDPQVERWLDQWGDVFVTGLTDDEVFIWRTCKRLEYKNIIRQVNAAAEAMANAAQGSVSVDDLRNDLFIEKIAEKCVLWPDINQDQITLSKAGTLDTLTNLVLEASNFIPHSLALRLTRKL